jgi:hypothetical protein
MTLHDIESALQSRASAAVELMVKSLRLAPSFVTVSPDHDGLLSPHETMRFHRNIALGSALVALAACSSDQSTSVPADSPATITVTSNGDGAGSLADALARASADERITEIALEPGVTSVGSRALNFRGRQLLTINGRGATISGETLRIAGAPVGVVIRNLTVAGAPGNGIEIDVPADATGDYVVRLQHVTVTDAVDHGVLVEDQLNNSAASIVLEVLHSTFTGNGNVAGASVSDRDGVRVNEGGTGDIQARIVQSQFRATAPTASSSTRRATATCTSRWSGRRSTTTARSTRKTMTTASTWTRTAPATSWRASWAPPPTATSTRVST